MTESDPSADTATTEPAGVAPVRPAAAAAIRKLTVDLAAALLAGRGSDGGNLACSGFGLWCALATLLTGADGETARELEATLGVGREQVGSDLITLDARLTELGGAAHAVAVWTRTPTYKAWRDALPGVGFASLDDPADLDAWVDERTHGLIERLPLSILPQTLLALVDVVTLFAGWVNPFDPARTTTDPFHAGGGASTSVAVPTMHQRLKRFDGFELARSADQSITRFSLICAAGSEEMVDGQWRQVPHAHLRLALGRPDQTPAEVLGALIAGSFSPMPADVVELSLPRFKIDTRHELNAVLANLGVRQALLPSADFSRLSPEPLMIDQAVQQAVVDVDEEGVKAAAVTAIAMRAAGMLHEQVVVELAFDRPFAFTLVDPELDLPLFAGWIADPST